MTLGQRSQPRQVRPVDAESRPMYRCVLAGSQDVVQPRITLTNCLSGDATGPSPGALPPMGDLSKRTTSYAGSSSTSGLPNGL